jgi:hypothetical protein
MIDSKMSHMTIYNSLSAAVAACKHGGASRSTITRTIKKLTPEHRSELGIQMGRDEGGWIIPRAALQALNLLPSSTIQNPEEAIKSLREDNTRLSLENATLRAENRQLELRVAEHNRFDALAERLLDNAPKRPNADTSFIWYDPDDKAHTTPLPAGSTGCVDDDHCFHVDGIETLSDPTYL